MIKLKQLIPDASSFNAMHPADLAGYMLEVLLSVGRDEMGCWNRGNFCNTAAQMYAGDEQIKRSCAEAWAWLESSWLIVRDPVQSNDWYIATRLGQSLRNRTQFKALVEGRELPEHFLHSAFLPDVRPLFLQGRYDLAVFESFHRLEIGIRSAAELGDEWIGVKLASRAFNPENGPLTESNDDPGERQALMNLMCGALGSYKNPQSHRHVGLDAPEAREIILMASHLMKIVDSRRRTT